MNRKILALLLALIMTVCLFVPATASAPSTRVQSLLNSMTLRQKITQMMMVDFRYWNTTSTGFTVMNDEVRNIIKNNDFGAIIYFKQNLSTTEQSYNLTMAMQNAAISDGGIPMIITCDQEGGIVYRLQTGTALPGNMAIGATHDTKYALDSGHIIGSELSSLGINSVLAPVVDVNNNANNPVIGLRSYGDDPDLVGNMASATIQGLKDYNVIGCAKHFPGHGDTATDSHYGLPTVNKTLAQVKACELKPYEIAIEQGVEMIMTAHILYPQLESDTIYSSKTGSYESLPATMSDDIITGILKEDMGFEGIVVTDAMNMSAIASYWTQTQACINAINAGVDMICMPVSLYDADDMTTLSGVIDGIVSAVNNGTIPLSRINDAVTRILTVKENRGILDWKESDFSLAKAKATVGSAENRELERRMAAAAVTVTKNADNTLPLKPTSSSKILMLSAYSDGKALMAMGWNRAKAAGVIPDGAEVKIMSYESYTSISSFQSSIQWADTIIITSAVSSASNVSGSNWKYSTNMKLADYAYNQGKKLITISTDKPYDTQYYWQSQAVMAVYGDMGSSVDVTEALTGSVTNTVEAISPNIIAGVEVAFGVFDAQGTLPVKVPIYSNGTFSSNYCYGNGYGYTYSANPVVHNLTLVPADPATCTEDGNTAYYTCSHCDNWYSDSSATTKITDKSSVAVEASGHTYSTVWSYNDEAHWQNATCGCDLTDNYGTHTDENGDSLCDSCGYVLYVLGDLDGNGEVEAVDYMIAKRSVLGTYELDSVQKKAGDIDGNGEVEAVDYMLIKRSVLGTYTIS
ncbi:MAG: beta-hexosaminidase [Clostridia bacterium]|nr:beta-hexosaminidase [Clostridia bacterium]